MGLVVSRAKERVTGRLNAGTEVPEVLESEEGGEEEEEGKS